MTSERAALGRYGEDLAEERYRAAGGQVLDRNWRCREGELDLVVLEPDGTLVFCEVKTRSGRGFGEPAEAVGAVKARRLRTVARRWLQDHPVAGRRELRFDVVAVHRRRGWAAELTHLRGVF
ncbi:MAG: YraN family protein [Actinomycetota bacterium]|nr:YraN family protein [Actinomycetota bacterium]